MGLVGGGGWRASENRNFIIEMNLTFSGISYFAAHDMLGDKIVILLVGEILHEYMKMVTV